jgi:tRNA dimethylallyltransferase
VTAGAAATPQLVLLGPTASGKSDVAMAAAQRVPGTEIVAVDAMQVYRGMDIGTAKPTAADQRAVRHHGIDLYHPRQDATVAMFRRAYDAALDDIDARGALALVVAGTGLYLTAVLDRLEVPGPYPAVRTELEADPDTASLHKRLAHLDPVAAARIEPSNRRRIVRALEVTVGSGRPFSSFGPGVSAFPPTDAVQLGIRWPRSTLAERIEHRVTAMMAAGLVDEVRRVRAQGLSRTAAQALGYKELIDHLDGRSSLDEAVAAIVQRTRQFAVRQERWFRRDPRVQWFDIDPARTDPLADVRDAATSVLTAGR